MKIWISGEIQDDVGEAFRLASNEVENAVNASLANRDYGSTVSKWALIPIVLPFEDERMGEVRRYDKRRRVAEFRLRIHHGTFKSTTLARQRSLVVGCLLRSVDLFPLLGVEGFDHGAFRADLKRAATENGWGEDLGAAGSGDSGHHMILVGAKYGGDRFEFERSKIQEVIVSVSKAANEVQSHSPGVRPRLNVVFCLPGSLNRPDWDHGRVAKYFEEAKQLLIEVAVPKQMVQCDRALDYVIEELHGANALAFEFYRQKGMQYPLAEAERLVAVIREIAANTDVGEKGTF